jgi:hypothetical protein
METRGKKGDEKVRPYVGSVRFQKDIESLSKINLSSEEISCTLDVPLSYVRCQLDRIQREREARQKFLMTGHIPRLVTPGVFTIFRR